MGAPSDCRGLRHGGTASSARGRLLHTALRTLPCLPSVRKDMHDRAWAIQEDHLIRQAYGTVPDCTRCGTEQAQVSPCGKPSSFLSRLDPESFHLLHQHHMFTRSSRRHIHHVILLRARGLALANHAPWQNEGPITTHAGCSSQPTSHLLRSSIDLGDPRPSNLIPSLHSPPL